MQMCVTKNLRTVLGPEFIKEAKKTAVIIKALYHLKSAGAVFKSHLASFMEFTRYLHCRVDPDLCMRPEIHPRTILCIHVVLS